MKRRPDGSGSLYKRRVDDRWFASAVTREPGGARRRRTVSATLFCTALRRISELNLPRADAPKPPPTRNRAAHMAAARALGTHTDQQWRTYRARVGNRCEYCGWETRFVTKDHRTPVSRGGSDAIDNLAVCCFRCNSLKNAMTESEFRAGIAVVGGIGPGFDRRRKPVRL